MREVAHDALPMQNALSCKNLRPGVKRKIRKQPKMLNFDMSRIIRVHYFGSRASTVAWNLGSPNRALEVAKAGLPVEQWRDVADLAEKSFRWHVCLEKGWKRPSDPVAKHGLQTFENILHGKSHTIQVSHQLHSFWLFWAVVTWNVSTSQPHAKAMPEHLGHVMQWVECLFCCWDLLSVSIRYA